MNKILFLLLVVFPNAIAYAGEFTDEQCSFAVAGIETAPSKITPKAV